MDEFERIEKKKAEDELKECTFTPIRYSKNPETKNFKEDFENRMNAWEKKRGKKIENLKQEIEEETVNKMPFNPSLSPMRQKIYKKYPDELSNSYYMKVTFL